MKLYFNTKGWYMKLARYTASEDIADRYEIFVYNDLREYQYSIRVRQHLEGGYIYFRNAKDLSIRKMKCLMQIEEYIRKQEGILS